MSILFHAHYPNLGCYATVGGTCDKEGREDYEKNTAVGVAAAAVAVVVVVAASSASNSVPSRPLSIEGLPQMVMKRGCCGRLLISRNQSWSLVLRDHGVRYLQGIAHVYLALLCCVVCSNTVASSICGSRVGCTFFTA